ncbi:hypothetical protein GCM10009613_39640 [Pseudonocardia kongjuensis]|uniref:TetR family transcriptional regulator n=1 Tax=Pseudonocardia kongjuensis TaxID=102227 RepID=A0ABN1XYT0_9PSEU
MPPPGRRRGRPAVVDRDRIAVAALEVGPGSLTLTAVAAHLGVHHSTLYGHVRDRDDLLAAAADRLAREADWPRAGTGWRELLTAWGDTFWELAGRRPGAAGLIRSLPAPPAAVVAEVGRVRADLEGHGFAPADALVALDMVADLALDTAAALEGLDRAAQDRAWRDDPGMRGLIAAPRGAYPVKLAIVLDGLAARLPR